MLSVPSVGERMVYKHTGHAFGLCISLVMQHLVCLQHQVGGFDIVPVRVVIRNRLPCVREVEVHHTGFDAYPVPNDRKQLLKPRSQSWIWPDAIEFGKCLEQVDVRVHGLVINGANRICCQHAVGHTRNDGRSVAREPFEVSAMRFVMSMFVRPDKPVLCEFESPGIMCSCICGRGSIDAKADAIELFHVSKCRRNLAVIVEPPEEAAILLVPHHVREEVDPMANERDVLGFEGRFTQYDLGGYPGHAPLKH